LLDLADFLGQGALVEGTKVGGVGPVKCEIG
jgi:hypothetical protein